MTRTYYLLILITIFVGNVSSLHADVRLARIFGSHMVLQRDKPISVWGWAEPDEQVTVSIAGHSAVAAAESDGTWRVTLPALSAGGPYELTVSGRNTMTLTDILLGEVWVCSGQSNMEYGVGLLKNSKEVISAADHPRIRLFAVPHSFSDVPLSDLKPAGVIHPEWQRGIDGRASMMPGGFGGTAEVQTQREKNANQWRVCSPETIVSTGWGGFSAAAYFFAVDVHKRINVPIGLIQAAYGGARIEPFIPIEGFKMYSERDLAKRLEAQNLAYLKSCGEWLTEFEKKIPSMRNSLSKGRMPEIPAAPNPEILKSWEHTAMFNGMIHPLLPMAIRGVLWHQGESNVGSNAYIPGQKLWYYEQMKELIGGWRQVWNQGDFPFYFCEQGPYRQWGKDGLPLHWTAQLASALCIPNTGVVVTTDIGEPWDLHPYDKETVGHRYALWALAKTYGLKDVVYSGPLYKSMKVEENRIRINFDSVGGGLSATDGKPLTHFEIASDDRHFVPATAAIDGSSVVVESPDVAKPAHVRFGWTWSHPLAPAPMVPPNLVNAEGLPAAPFHTEALANIAREK